MAKLPRPPGEIDRKYDHQIKALRESAKNFDAGEVWEAERISNAVQTLCHTGGQSVSLLSQVGMHNRLFLDSADAWNPANKIANCGLVSIAQFAAGTSWLAELDDRPMRFLPFDTWWNAPVLTNGADYGDVMSRKDLVRVMRNQDGGGHVDPMIDSAYAGMLNAIGFVDENDMPVTKDGEYFAMRQIGHELLKSLIPTYRRRPNKISLKAMWRELVFEEVVDKSDAINQNFDDYTQTLPAEECPCGSMIKFRACHAKGAQQPALLEMQGSQIVAPPGAAFAQVGIGLEPN